MAVWGRNTPWRQGHLLSTESAKELGLFHQEETAETLVLVISHDCDLAQGDLSLEPACEVIVGRVIEFQNGNYAWAKNVRKLHLSFSAGTVKLIGEFVATDRRIIDKSALAGHEPVANVRLDPDELTVLQGWLSARYRRSAFPDEFQNRMVRVRDKLTKILAGTGDNIVSIFFAVDRGEDVDRQGPDDVYDLTIFLLTSAEKDPKEVDRVAVDVRRAILDLFRKAFKVGGKWQNIELRDCYTISEETMTVRQSRRLKRWHTDYLSLRPTAKT